MWERGNFMRHEAASLADDDVSETVPIKGKKIKCMSLQQHVYKIFPISKSPKARDLL